MTRSAGTPPTALDMILGVGSAGVDLARWSLRTATRTIGQVYPPAGRLASAAAERARADAEAVMREMIVRIVGITVTAVDLTKLVRENVDLDAVVEDVDVAAILDRIDLAGVARQVIDEIDLPEVVRESSGALASEAVEAARIRAIQADGMLAREPRDQPPTGDPAGRVPAAAAQHRPAGVVTRLLGAALDAGMVAVLALVLYLGVAGLRLMWWPASFQWPHPPVLVSVASAVGIAILYLAIGWVTTGRSLGGSVLGFRVLSKDRSLLGWPRAGARAALYVVFPIGLLLAAIGPARRSLQDRLLGSTVVYDWHHDGGARATTGAPAGPAVLPLKRPELLGSGGSPVPGEAAAPAPG